MSQLDFFFIVITQKELIIVTKYVLQNTTHVIKI